MRLKITVIFLFLIFNLNAQEDKPRYYYDENELQISKELYNKKVNLDKGKYKYLKLNFKNDTCYVSLLVRRKKYGKLKIIELDSLHRSLTDTITNSRERYTIIQYHPGADKCNNGKALVMLDKKTVLNKRLFKKAKKDFGLKNYWIHKNDEKVNYKKVKSVNWQVDKNRTVEKLFFKLHYPCHSFVIIDNQTGNFVSYFGEYHSLLIIELFKELTNID
jgi:hypothetical protein